MHASGGWRLVALGLLGAAAVVVLFAGLTRSEQRAIERAAWRELVGVWEAGKEEYVAYFVEHSYHDELKRHYGEFTPREGEELERARFVREVREYLRENAVEGPDPGQDVIARRGNGHWRRTRRIMLARMPPRGGIQGVPHLLLIAERDGYETSLRAEALLIDRNSNTDPLWADQLRVIFEPHGIPISITWR
ncbi:MAG: hypothetical protein O2816_16905 [Planctomycetota bacterium]|nr:hypothetical protein [Planctomycetota bacterium]